MVAVEDDRQQLRDPTSRAATHGELYELHVLGLRRRCLRLTRDPDAADDLVQEVFVRFMARFPEPPADMNVGGYLYAAARNVLWKQLRDDREIADPEIERTIGPDDDLDVDPERSMLLVEQQSLVRRCSALLTGRQRRALTLREVEGHSYAEIGGDLGIGPDAVAQVISRARARLRVAVRRAHVDLDQLTPECRAMLGPLSDYLDGHASSSSREIEAHLAECEACRQTLAAYRGAGSRLRGTLPFAPLAGVLARIGEAVRLGGGAPVDAVRGGVIVAALALALGGGGAVVVQQATAGSHARASVAQAQVGNDRDRGGAPASASPPVARAPSTARGRSAESGASAPRAGHPGTQETTDASGAAPSAAPKRELAPRATPGSAPVASPTTPAADPGSTKPATMTKPATTTPPPTKPPVDGRVVPPVVPPGDVTHAADPITQPVGTGVVAPVADKVVAPVVKKVVDPIVEKVVVPVVEQVVAPVTAAVAPVTDPVTKALAPVTDPVAKSVGAAVAPASTTPQAPPPDATPVVKLPVIQIGGIKIGG